MTRKIKTRRRTIMRHDIRRPEDHGETFEDIEKRVGKPPTGEALAAGTTGPTVTLERNSIRVATAVFQWRIPKRNMLPSDDHIFRMARSLQEQRTPLPPIIVFPVGDAFYVMDGHHRLAAYDTARWTKAIPAQVYQGSLEAAWRSALGRNSRDKLPMAQEDKTAAAWRIVKKADPRDSISGIMALTGVSKGTVDNMRKVWRTINDGKHGEAPASVLETIAQPDAQGLKLLRDAAETMRLSARGYHRVLRVARTLADLDGAEKIGRLHLAEALSYRALAEDLRRAA
jgi:hypothetical protein